MHPESTLLRTFLDLLARPIDISSDASGQPAVARRLSNFTARPFIFDGIAVQSMESFLQALKFPDEQKQITVCSLPGRKAKNAGKKGNKHWIATQELHWQGQCYQRSSAEYQQLIARAYRTCCDANPSFRFDLRETGSRRLRHSIGKNDPRITVLTEREFVTHLKTLRATAL